MLSLQSYNFQVHLQRVATFSFLWEGGWGWGPSMTRSVEHLGVHVELEARQRGVHDPRMHTQQLRPAAAEPRARHEQPEVRPQRCHVGRLVHWRRRERNGQRNRCHGERLSYHRRRLRHRRVARTYRQLSESKTGEVNSTSTATISPWSARAFLRRLWACIVSLVHNSTHSSPTTASPRSFQVDRF